jgi:predicted DNA-binding protein with PD1-like motif
MVACGTGSLEVTASLIDCAHVHAQCAVAEQQSVSCHAAQARPRCGSLMIDCAHMHAQQLSACRQLAWLSRSSCTQ